MQSPGTMVRACRPTFVPRVFRRRAVAAAVRRVILIGALSTTAFADTSKLIFTNPDQLLNMVGTHATLVDIDGDGDLDIFIGTYAGTIRYFENVGSRMIPQYVERTGAANPLNAVNVGGQAAPAFVDIDGDGDYDVFIGASNGSLQYYQNIGSDSAPSFLPQTGASNPFNGVSAGTRSAPVFVDLDGDGNKDALVGNYNGTVLYFQNTGTPTSPVFTQRTGAANPFNGVDVGYTSTPAVVDIDADGDFDVFIGNKNGSISYYENTGTRTSPVFVPRSGAANPLNGISIINYSNSAPTFADIDGDGDFDVLIAGSTGALQSVINVGSPSSPNFARVNPLTGVNVKYASTPVLVDIDGDGDLDAFIGNYNGTVNYFENIGTNQNPQFIERTGTANPLSSVSVGTYSTISFVDIDGDGDLDAFIGASDGSIHFFANTGSANSPVFTEMSGAANPLGSVNVGANSAPTFVDIDGDGANDAVIGAADGTLHFYRNTGTPVSPNFISVTGSADPFNGITVGSESKPVFADIDGDGDFDLVIGASTGLLRLFENTGSATTPVFTERTGTNNPLAAINVQASGAPALADIDGDGDIDLFVGGYYGAITYFRNDTLFADLAITQSVTPNPALLQSPTDFSLTVTNTGRDTATGVVITDTLPAGSTFVAASSDDGGSCSATAGVVTCLLNDVIRNGVVHIDVSASPTSLATMSNTASVTATELDSIQTNNQTTESLPVSPVADVGVSLVPSPDPVLVGGSLSYAVTLDNQGPSTATGVVLSDVLPGGALLVSASSAGGSCTTVGSTLTCTMNDLPSGSSELVTLVIRPSLTGALVNTLGVSANEADLNVANNNATATVTVNPAVDLGLTVAPSPNPVYAGTDLSYAVTISNQGPSVATSLALHNVLPDGVTLVSATSASGTCATTGSTVICNMNDLLPGSTELVTLVTKPFVAGTLNNVMSVSANETELNPADNSTTVAVLVSPAADVGISLAPSPDPVLVGGNLSYAVTLDNQGPSTATGVVLSDVLPGSVLLVSASSAGGRCTTVGSTLTCTMNALPSGSSELVTLVIRPSLDGSLVNTLGVSANEADLNMANNSATATVTVNPAIDLGLTVTPSPDPVNAGTDLSYAATISNQGPSVATGMALRNVLPGGVTLVSATSASGTCTTTGSVVSCNMNDLLPGSTELVTLVTKPSVAGVLYNVMSVGANETELNPADNSAAAAVTVNPAAAVGVSIVPSQNPVYAGSVLSYSVTLSNQGPSVATGLMMTDVLPSDVSLVSVTTDSGTCSTAGSTVTCAMNDLLPGSDALVTLVTRPGVAGSLDNTLSVSLNEVNLNPSGQNAAATVMVTPPPDNSGGGALALWNLVALLGALLRRRLRYWSSVRHDTLPRRRHE